MRMLALLQVCTLIVASIIVVIPTVKAGDSTFEGLLIRGRAAAIIPQKSADISAISADVDINPWIVDVGYRFKVPL